MRTRFSEFKSRTGLAYGIAGCVFCVCCAPHLVPNMLMKESKADIPVPRELQNHVENIAKAMHIAQPQRIKVYINKGLSSVSAGNTLLPGGAVIGLSRVVLARNENDILKSGIMANGQSITPYACDLPRLLLPTTNQINFAIGHELAHIQNLDFLLRAMVPSVTFITLYHASCLLPPLLYPANPFAVVPMILAVGLLMYAQVHFAICHWQEHRADRRSAMNSSKYTEGGMDMMSKRMALDQLMRPVGSSLKIKGFKPHPPTESRLQRLNEIRLKQQSSL